MAMGNHPHAPVIPYPAQGHVIPFMELSHCLIDSGFRITFVNTEFIRARVMAALSKSGRVHRQLRLVAIPDGMEPEEDRNEVGKLCDCILQCMPGSLEELICKINESDDDDKITCIIADGVMSWAVEVAAKMGIRGVAFWTASMFFSAISFHMPKLVEDRIIDADGFLAKVQMIKLSPTLPAMSTTQLPWRTIADRTTQQQIFHYAYKCTQFVKYADWFLCNSCYEIEEAACELIPQVLPIGPLIAGSRLGRLEGNFWPEDSTFLNWLDEQPAKSVIYIAFGSWTIFDRHQFQELALGLEHSKRPFLWVVRPNLTDGSSAAYPDGFKTRVAGRGCIVGWSPQQKVLAHPSIACFVTHCGWNSTMEGLSNGVPLLCWPSFGDQLFNESYISDFWKVGLGLKKDGDGIVSRDVIKGKIEQLLGDESMRSRALDLKAIARKSVDEGGSSWKNFNEFVEAMK